MHRMLRKRCPRAPCTGMIVYMSSPYCLGAASPFAEDTLPNHAYQSLTVASWALRACPGQTRAWTNILPSLLLQVLVETSHTPSLASWILCSLASSQRLCLLPSPPHHSYCLSNIHPSYTEPTIYFLSFRKHCWG